MWNGKGRRAFASTPQTPPRAKVFASIFEKETLS
jgi:hypothetical protein